MYGGNTKTIAIPIYTFTQLKFRACHIIKSYMFTKFHTFKHLGRRVTQTCMLTLSVVVVRKGNCLPTSYQNVYKFHTSKHLGKRVTQCMFTLFFVVVQ